MVEAARWEAKKTINMVMVLDDHTKGRGAGQALR